MLSTEQTAALLAELPALTRLARGMGLADHDADDVVHTAVLRALPHWNRIDGRLGPYLRRVIVNLIIDRGRRAAVLREEPLGGPDSVGSRAREESRMVETRIDIGRALDALPIMIRQVPILRYLGDQTIAATAYILGRPEGTIARLTHEGLARLRTQGLLELSDNEKRGETDEQSR